jgi:transposase
MNQHLIPYERTAEICSEVLGASVSVGMLCELNTVCHELLSTESAAIKAEITASDVVSFDETGLRCESKLQWCHTASTETSTHYEVHEKRGRVAMDAIGILPNFKGIAVHDHFKSYFEYSCEHALCNAHHMRELKFVHEEDKEQWAGEMRGLLKMANEAQNLSVEKRAEIEKLYDDIVARGHAFHATLPDFSERKKGTRGRQKQRPSKNLLTRLDHHKAQVLRFLDNPNVPFTNNQGERDLRMQKLKQKISGCHRTSHGAQTFCRIRGFLSTAKKRGLNSLTALADVLRGKSVFAHTPNTG